MVKEQFILQDLIPSSLCLLQFYISSHVGMPILGGTDNFGWFFHGQKYPARLSHFIMSLLLSQALYRSASLLFSGLRNANLTSKTQLIGPYLPLLISIHMLSILGPPSLLLTLHQCVCNAFFWASSVVSPWCLWISVTPSFPHLPCACSSFPKTSHVHQPTHPRFSGTQISSLSSFQTWLSNAAGQHSNFSLTTSHLPPPLSLIFLEWQCIYLFSKLCYSNSYELEQQKWKKQ